MAPAARFLPDTSCIVAAICSWHVYHTAAAGEIARRLDQGQAMVTAAPALVEAYAVLTRLPPPRRLSPADALALLEGSFIQGREIVTLDAGAYLALLRRGPAEGFAGGRTYDAVIATCAAQAMVGALLTLNERQFRPFATAQLTIVVPGQT